MRTEFLCYNKSGMRYLLLIVLSIILTGCFATTHELQTKFNPKDVSWINDKGNATIKGQAFLNTKGGTVVTCAGNTVSLTPVNSYSSERMNAIYGSNDSGYKDELSASMITFKPKAPQEYYSLTRTTRCDAQGNFKFKDVLSGKGYYITTTVIWGVEWVKEGGYLMLKVNPASGETLEVILN